MDTLSVKGVIDPKTIKIGQSPDTAVKPENLTVRHDHGAIPGTKPSAIDEPVVLTPEGQAFGKLALASNAMSAMDTSYSSWLVELVADRNNRFFAVIRESGNPRVYALDGKELRGRVSNALRKNGQRPTQKAINELLDELRGEAEATAVKTDVWSRVAQLSDGTRVIALHDAANTHVYIQPGAVKLVTEGSKVMFSRSSTAEAMTIPAEHGDYMLLKPYLNLSAEYFLLFIAWLSYTLAHAKQAGNVFVILYLIGGQGSGKSVASKIAIRLVDPNVVGVERLPKLPKDLGIAAQNAHLLAYDNLRSIKPEMSDTLCVLATGGSITTRRLYTNDEQHVTHLLSALLLNGIYSFVDQPDLAQRCLPLRMYSMDESQRKSEAQMWNEFEADLPVIQRGLFDLISQILVHLPTVEVTTPQRMYSFVQWLAAMEKVQGIPAGIYQESYAAVLNEGQLDSIRDSVLGSAVLDFAKQLKDRTWSGTPQELLNDLNTFMAFGFQRPPRGWPDNPIALSKRLSPLETALRTQGVVIRSERRKERQLTITTKDIQNEKY
jgi:hypothetical protein